MKRVCLFTGSSGTLGRAFCRLHADKYHIAAVYRRSPPDVPSQRQWFVDPLEPAVVLPENANPVFAIQADLTDDRALERVVELALARFDRIDLLVHAAAYYLWSAITDTEKYLESIGPQLDLNVTVPLKLTALVVREFWRDRAGENREHNRNVINLSSVSGLAVYIGLGQSIYSASKSALNVLSCHLSHELRPVGVRVNAIAPTSFPLLIPTESVCESILRLDNGGMTGSVVVLDQAATPRPQP